MNNPPDRSSLPPDHNGIVWVSKNNEPKHDVFNEPWMDNLDRQLLFRYWRHKGSPGYLYTWHSGVKMWHRKIEEQTISIVACPLFDSNPAFYPATKDESIKPDNDE